VRIGYLIGGLQRGGAELQLLALARSMVRRGHDVELLAYDGHAPLDEALRAEGVHVQAVAHHGRAAKLSAVRRWFLANDLDVAHAVMKRASSLAVMARFPRRVPPVIATDMSTATYGRHKPVLWASLVAFGLADRVVTQTELNRKNLERLAPWLRGKTEVIRNGLDTERFSPGVSSRHDKQGDFRFCCVGTVYAVKNPDRVVRAAAELRRRGRTGFRVDWYGRLTTPGGVAEPNPPSRTAEELGVDDIVRFHGDTAAIEQAYRSSDALLHASLQEGFPNAVAEGMACGLPVVVSTVSDLPLVVKTAVNGFVFDERDVAAIASAMERMLDTAEEERRAMGARSRELALRWFSSDRFADEFEALYRRLGERA
jgi:glycosyltransferase involved in cell wall biosynthesis